MKETKEELFATNYSLSQLLVCLVDLQKKINKPTGEILYAINKNKTKLVANAKEVNEARIDLLKSACKLDKNGGPLMKAQGKVDNNDEEVDTAVFKSTTTEKNFNKEYTSLMNAENKDFKFFKIPLSRWKKVVMKEEEEEVVNLDYLFEYIIDDKK